MRLYGAANGRNGAAPDTGCDQPDRGDERPDGPIGRDVVRRAIRKNLATKKIRVYELARELGVENQVVLDLSDELKMGVKSHSSSIDDPSADRIRRLADSRGLRGEPIVDEPKPAPKAKAKADAPVKKTVAVRGRAGRGRARAPGARGTGDGAGRRPRPRVDAPAVARPPRRPHVGTSSARPVASPPRRARPAPAPEPKPVAPAAVGRAAGRAVDR